MKNTFGNNVSVTLFGESHGAAIGVVLDGVAPNIPINRDRIDALLSLRRPSGDISTSRKEKDEYIIESGVFEGKTTGTPICILIPNADTKSADYGDMRYNVRPSHADFAADVKYGGAEDYRGGGHQSGRLTAALVAAAGILIPALENKGIYIGTHIKSIAGVEDRDFSDIAADIASLKDKYFAVLDESAEEKMTEKILLAKAEGDSVGGVLSTAIVGLPAGVGEPWFDTLEGVLAHALFSVPAVKGVEFGAGFSLATMKGSEANDAFYMENGEIKTKTNSAGGINGGITNGMPVTFNCVIRPTPTIAKEQEPVNIKTRENATLAAKGRHDACIVHRARAVIDAVTAIALADVLATRFGTDWLAQ